MINRSSMMKELSGNRRKRSQERKMARTMAGAPPAMESPRKKMASGMKAPAAMEMPMAMKKGGMAKKPKKPKMAKGGMMIVIGVGKPKTKKGK